MQQQEGAYKQTQQQPSAEVGTLEEALGAFGLAHLWPVMRDEEMDVETYIMLEYQDLVDLGVEPCDQPMALELIEALKLAKE
mmetsp:Transcript_6882/g.16528  ORF Transcript_6882/g.16528 Transcript_6882/m.16528 type:complete len:82 (-) Transcript_6882:289-534(-)